jgi:hypothetical protein
VTSWASTLKWQDEQREAELERLWRESKQPLLPNLGKKAATVSDLYGAYGKMREHIDDLWKLITSHRHKITELEHPEWYDTHA